MSSARIPSLDGLRAISIAFVFIQHSVSSTGNGAIEQFTTNFGRLGVWIFFVISGFIITNLLLREADRGAISLRQFYLRRALRLLPALFAFLIFLAFVQAFTDLEVAPIHLISGALFLVPYVPWGAEHHPWSSGHLWSLAVEEHFYLLWPPLLAWLGVKRAKWLLVAFVVIVPAFRVLWYKLKLDPLANSLVGIGDLMAYGALAAIWHHYRPEQMRRVVNRSVFVGRMLAMLAVGSVLLLRTAEVLPMFTVPLGMTVVGIAVAYLLLSVCFVPVGWLVKVLNLPAVAWVGSISYSLYLWQQPFLHKFSVLAEWWQQLPVSIAFAVIAAVACHYLIERPFLNLKSRFKPRGAPL